ncbi:NAD(P)H-dependent D-xylose reductase xyl1 [Microbotryum lychnidis-dioicae p1A1 Lamole]|uniref:NAD(P)H-dependent D-xylose reductase xyl1 n=2 Tax=Microbotryum TaxID=34416 RepID=U5HIE5_USTV1|nr:NAD(P)H-dependent D-xylose reductase xyl1 [Microbotryum lychnidis-dioicae p1A1 Lamole]SGY98215.1 BQ5605_C035g11450 [Microbotryum silenes-dioicae]|eukprot:KDE02644.1 NAD(P)H-dependent D-xylose reductase xyl1 [Microbotryum lychnidis-dioicae p1A1 Lamole]
MPVKSLKIANGSMPTVGFGLWKVPKPQCADVVYNALKLGYRLLDGAADYGNSKEAGEGLARAIKDGVVTREEVFVTSKLWNTNHAYEHVVPAAKHELSLWGLDYFDLYLIHFPVSLEYVDPNTRFPPEWWDGKPGGKVTPSNDPISDTWRGMEDVHNQGLAKNIGVSNFCGGLLIDLFRSAKVKPSVLQIEHHPYLQQPALLKLAQETLGMAVTAYSSLGPQSFLELDHPGAVKTPSLLEHDVIKKIASKHGKGEGQVLFRWATQRNVAIIPKSNNDKRAEANLASVEFDLDAEDLKAIEKLDIGLRFNNPGDIDPRLAIFA